MKSLVFILVGFSHAAFADPIAVPSGQMIEFAQVIWTKDSDLPEAVFRFLAPEIARDGSGVSYEVASNDTMFLCQNFALPRVREREESKDVALVISLSEKTLEFGESNPEITQFFESFVVREEQCNWGDI